MEKDICCRNNELYLFSKVQNCVRFGNCCENEIMNPEL